MVAKGIHELASQLRTAGKHVTIETAGTIAPDGIACDLASISPKLASSTPTEDEISGEWVERHERTRIQPDVLRQWVSTYPYQLKFVVTCLADMVEIESLLSAIGVPILPEKVLLMPEGTDLGTLHSRREMLVELCKGRGYRYCDRLHVALFGHTRGT
jgi:7-carboxy-7-deazaguanine synthase